MLFSVVGMSEWERRGSGPMLVRESAPRTTPPLHAHAIMVVCSCKQSEGERGSDGNSILL